MNANRGLLVAVVLAAVVAASLLAGAGSAHADRAAADFFVQRGEKALKDKKWDEAQDQFRKALEEHAQHVAARVGLGEAFFGAGNRGAAVEAWRLAVTHAAETKPLPLAWGEPLTRARKRLTELDAAGTALAQLVDKHVEKLVALAEKWEQKDPEVMARALRDAVRLRPAHPKASAMFAKIGSPPGEWVQLFDGRTRAGWDITENEKMWVAEEGQLVGDLSTGTVFMGHFKQFKGDVDYRIEAKILERRAGGYPAVFAMYAQMQFNMTGTALAIVDGANLTIREIDGPEREANKLVYTEKIAELPTPFDPHEWTRYEIQFRGTRLNVLVNGVEVLTRERSSGRAEGSLGFLIQSIRVAVRKAEALPR